jgi:hypothetical protein
VIVRTVDTAPLQVMSGFVGKLRSIYTLSPAGSKLSPGLLLTERPD